MNQQNLDAWIAALRSGNYQQGDEYLHRIVEYGTPEQRDTYCCLGVCYEVMGVESDAQVVGNTPEVIYYYGGSSDQLHDLDMVEWLGLEVPPDLAGTAKIGLLLPEDHELSVKQAAAMVESDDRWVPTHESSFFSMDVLNDTHGWTFEQIADGLETYEVTVR